MKTIIFLRATCTNILLVFIFHSVQGQSFYPRADQVINQIENIELDGIDANMLGCGVVVMNEFEFKKAPNRIYPNLDKNQISRVGSTTGSVSFSDEISYREMYKKFNFQANLSSPMVKLSLFYQNYLFNSSNSFNISYKIVVRDSTIEFNSPPKIDLSDNKLIYNKSIKDQRDRFVNFVDLYGSHFVKAIHFGYTLDCTINYQDSKSISRQEFSGKISAFLGSVSASLTQEQISWSKNLVVNTNFQSKTVDGQILTITNLSDLKNVIESIRNGKVKLESTPISADIVSYKNYLVGDTILARAMFPKRLSYSGLWTYTDSKNGNFFCTIQEDLQKSNKDSISIAIEIVREGVKAKGNGYILTQKNNSLSDDFQWSSYQFQSSCYVYFSSIGSFSQSGSATISLKLKPFNGAKQYCNLGPSDFDLENQRGYYEKIILNNNKLYEFYNKYH